MLRNIHNPSVSLAIKHNCPNTFCFDLLKGQPSSFPFSLLLANITRFHRINFNLPTLESNLGRRREGKVVKVNRQFVKYIKWELINRVLDLLSVSCLECLLFIIITATPFFYNIRVLISASSISCFAFLCLLTLCLTICAASIERLFIKSQINC